MHTHSLAQQLANKVLSDRPPIQILPFLPLMATTHLLGLAQRRHYWPSWGATKKGHPHQDQAMPHPEVIYSISPTLCVLLFPPAVLRTDKT